MPPAITKLPRDRRGIPIPYIVACDAEGAPDFRINDIMKMDRCNRLGLCTITGEPMKASDIWLIGGPDSAFHPTGCYLDPPASREALV